MTTADVCDWVDSVTLSSTISPIVEYWFGEVINSTMVLLSSDKGNCPSIRLFALRPLRSKTKSHRC